MHILFRTVEWEHVWWTLMVNSVQTSCVVTAISDRNHNNLPHNNLQCITKKFFMFFFFLSSNKEKNIFVWFSKILISATFPVVSLGPSCWIACCFWGVNKRFDLWRGCKETCNLFVKCSNKGCMGFYLLSGHRPSWCNTEQEQRTTEWPWDCQGLE